MVGKWEVLGIISLLFGTLFAYSVHTDNRVVEPAMQWRLCSPAQDGHELVSTTQWDDHTDCFYQKKSGRVPSIAKRVSS